MVCSNSSEANISLPVVMITMSAGQGLNKSLTSGRKDLTKIIEGEHQMDIFFGCNRLWHQPTFHVFGAISDEQKWQPALLYLVPCTLGVTVILGCIRGELKKLWNYGKDSSLSTESYEV